MCDCVFTSEFVRFRQPASLDINAYNRWLNMMNRCYNPQNKDFKNYGARGIRVCLRWAISFEVYMKDVGEKPDGKTLDRSNNDLGYCPCNTAWKNRSDQNKNRRDPKKKSTLPKGVAFNKSNGHYLAQIRIDGSLHYIGSSKDLQTVVDMFKIIHFEWYGKNP